MDVPSPETIYRQLLEKYGALLEQLLHQRKQLGRGRFAVFLVTIVLSYKIFVTAGLAGLAPLVLGIAVLLFLVSKDVNNNRKIAHTRALIRISEEELKILRHDFHERFSGAHYLPDVHDYAQDLDLFGRASLFQWLNRCQTEGGRNLLAKNMLAPLPVEEIRQRHEAVRELTPAVEWRQQLEAFARHKPVTVATEEKARNWLQQTDQQFTRPFWTYLVPIYSLITVATAAAAIAGYLPGSIFLFLYVCYFSISTLLSRNTIKPYIELSGIVSEIQVLEQLLKWIEGKKFSAPLLVHLQEECGPGSEKASNEIARLRAVLDRFDLRLNMAGPLLLNSFFLWDVRQMMALNHWRKKNREQVSAWFSLIAEMEVLSSLSALHFNHPGSSFPEFTGDYFYLDAKALGHPLIKKENRVSSDFHLEGHPKIALVTGSNMAGKSTFLRSLGVNIVLAQMGAPVCARQLRLSPVRLMSSMRIADNLAENTSTFYAELKKLKSIIEAVRQHERVFILLDEILRGTNSHDRHTGSEALLAQLIREHSVAVLATHDLALAQLEKRFPEAVKNYHFDVQVDGEELYFDYRLKEGVCTSLNASILMKKIGIELPA